MKADEILTVDVSCTGPHGYAGSHADLVKMKLLREIAWQLAEMNERAIPQAAPPSGPASRDIALRDCPTCFTRMEAVGFDPTHTLFQCPACGKQIQGATRQEWATYIAFKRAQKLQQEQVAPAETKAEWMIDTDEEVGYIARSRKYRWISGYGDTPDEAIRMAKENLASVTCKNCGVVDGEPLSPPGSTPNPSAPQPFVYQEAACVPEPDLRGALLADMQRAYIEGSKHHPPCATDVCCIDGMRQAACVAMEAVKGEARRVLVMRNYVQHGTVLAIQPDLFERILDVAASNLLPEVPR